MPMRMRPSSGQRLSDSWRSSATWRALGEMRIEPEGASLTFARRLARENGWSRRHAEAVVDEYRRFLYLAALSGGPLTPSGDVDQAWHLHLLYSRHYWDVLCGKILGRPLHHGPTAGGEAESERFGDQYEATLRLYRAIFGVDAPTTIWPPASIRFSSTGLWVDRQLCWVIPKAFAGRAVLALGAISTAACSAAAAGGAGSDLVYAVGAIALIVIVLALLIGLGGKKRRRRGADGCDSGFGSSDGDGDGDGDGSGCGGGCGGD